jgi:hypothetical protein
MQPNGTVDINDTIAAWADIVIEKFHAKITELKVYDKGNLDHSLMQELLVNSGVDIDKIEFSFKLYGVFVDMGVGKELSKGNSGDIGSKPTRQPKEWFSKKYFGQVMRLKELLMEQYSKAIAYTMVNTLSEDFDQRFKGKGEDAIRLYAKTAGSLRTVKYREQNNARTMRNYYERRSKGGHWTNDHKTWKN